MKHLFTLLLLCIILSSCKKQYVDPSRFEYCKFSLFDGNNKLQRAYYIRNDSLFDHTPDIQRSGLLSHDQYLKAAVVVDEIPLG